jgi:hypothetical protein
MTKDEIDQLKADIKAEVIKELTGKDYKSTNCGTGAFASVRNKYRKDFLKTFGVYHCAMVWDNIRRLTCYMVGVKYIRELTPSLEIKAAEIAEKLCVMAIESKELSKVE